MLPFTELERTGEEAVVNYLNTLQKYSSDCDRSSIYVHIILQINMFMFEVAG